MRFFLLAALPSHPAAAPPRFFFGGIFRMFCKKFCTLENCKVPNPSEGKELLAIKVTKFDAGIFRRFYEDKVFAQSSRERLARVFDAEYTMQPPPVGVSLTVTFNDNISSEIKDEICSKLASAFRALKSRISRICGINELERRTVPSQNKIINS